MHGEKVQQKLGSDLYLATQKMGVEGYFSEQVYVFFTKTLKH